LGHYENRAGVDEGESIVKDRIGGPSERERESQMEIADCVRQRSGLPTEGDVLLEFEN
jgi:hypothetical protein